MPLASVPWHDRLSDNAVTFPIRLNGRDVLFRRPADSEALLDRIECRAFANDEQMPYWAEHWPAADVALAFLTAWPLPASAVVCEIGCGLGVVSAVLASQCAMAVGMDISADGCRYAAANIASAGTAPRIVCGDWRRPPLRGKFDAIVAVDVLYEPRWVTPIARFIRNHLAEHGMALVVDPCRPPWHSFRTALLREGLVAALAHTAYTNHGRTRVEVLRIVA